MKQSRKIYDRALKRKLFNWVMKDTYRELARELGITAPQLYKWRKVRRVWTRKFWVIRKLWTGTNSELERKLKDAELERDILKAIGIFPKRSMIYVFIKKQWKDISDWKDVQSLQVGQRSYQWKSQSVSDRKQRVVLVKEKNFHLFWVKTTLR
jgi:transposase